MAKPTTITDWATDAGATSDPGPTRRATGFIAGKKLPAKWLNWLLSQNAQWLTYLRDLHIEPEFLNQVYTWTGAHGFNQSIGAYNDVVFGPNSDPMYGDALGVQTPREVTVPLPLTGFGQAGLSPEGEGQWVMEYGGGDPINSMRNYLYWATSGNGQLLVGEFRVPHGAILRTLRFRAKVGGGTMFDVDAGVHDIEGVTNGRNPRVSLTLSTQDGITPTSLALGDLAINGAMDLFHVSFKIAGSGPSWSVEIRDVALTYLDPGPRNY
jgi:hypothetical protein